MGWNVSSENPVARPRIKEFSGGLENHCVTVYRLRWLATKSELGVYIIRHVAVTDGRHGDHCPPESVWDRLEEGILRAGLGEVDGAREEHDTCKEERGGECGSE